MASNSKKILDPDAYAARLINQAREHMSQMSPSYIAPWLLEGGIGSKIWIVSGNDSSPIIEFNVLLPDGTTLTDGVNVKLLETIQRFAFDLRQGYLDTSVGYERWKRTVTFACDLACWINVNKTEYHPDKYGFYLLDENGCRNLIFALAQGGWQNAFSFKERITEHFYDILKNDVQSAKIDGVSFSDFILKDHSEELIAWLKRKNLYSYVKDHNRTNRQALISRKYLSKILSIDKPALLNHPAIRLYLRQLEPELAHDSLLIGAEKKKKNHYSQNTPLISDSENHSISEKSLKNYIELLQTFLRGNSRLNSEIPNIAINKQELMKQYSTTVVSNKHTNKIPYSIGMHILEKSIEWIMVYGQPIINATCALVEKFESSEFKTNFPVGHAHTHKERYFKSIIGEFETTPFELLKTTPLATKLNITSLQSMDNRKPSKDDICFLTALNSLIGACAITIAIMKPLRVKELASIERHSLSANDPDEGAFLTHTSQKSGMFGFNPNIRRPIPYITAYAIQLLQVLGSRLQKIYSDHSPRGNILFYFPTGRGFGKPENKKLSSRIDKAIGIFCDVIETAIDVNGRRWYPKTHELRKFFILTMHDHEDKFSEEPLRYHAGHVDRSHLDDYLSGEIPSDEKIKYDCECVDDKLLQLELGELDPRKHSGLTALYNDIRFTFGIDSIKSRKKEEYYDFLGSMIHNGKVELSTYYIKLESYDGTVFDIDIALKYGEHTDENYKYK